MSLLTDPRAAAQMTHTRPIQSERPLADWLGSMNTMQKLGLLQVPVISDVAGFVGDIQQYRDEPESRGLLNYGLTGMGLLPFVPGAFGIVKSKPIEAMTKKKWGQTSNYKETGFVMDDGTMLDMSGRAYPYEAYNQTPEGFWELDPIRKETVSARDYLKNQRYVAHEEVADIVGGNDPATVVPRFMDATGAIRVWLRDTGASLHATDRNLPSPEAVSRAIEWAKIKDIPLDVEVQSLSGKIVSGKSFANPTINSVMSYLRKAQQ